MPWFRLHLLPLTGLLLVATVGGLLLMAPARAAASADDHLDDNHPIASSRTGWLIIHTQ